MERIRVIDAAKMVMELAGHSAEISLKPEMPIAPLNCVADNAPAIKLLDWEPQVPFRQGLKRTIDGYFSSKNVINVASRLEFGLTER